MDEPPVTGAATTGPAGSDPAPRRGAELRTFLIADIRGYTSYTEERGDEAAAILAADFAALVETVATEFEGVLLEVRGDEALVVFFSARQALRAAVELQSRAGQLARPIGIGLDAGEAIPVGTGYRGTALNVAARLCAQAKGGEIVASEAVIHMAARIDGVSYIDARTVRLKGLEEAVRAVTVVPETDATRRRGRSGGGGPVGRRVVLPIAAGALVVGALVVAVGVGALGPTPFGGPTAAPSRPPASAAPADFAVQAPGLALLDATDDTLVSAIVARNPGDQAIFAEGAFWQVETDPAGILRIDPASGQVTPIPITTRQPGGIAIDGQTMWIADRGAARLERVDIPSATALPDLRLTSDPSDTRGVDDVVIAGGSVWASRANPGEVVRLDPADGRVIRSFAMPAGRMVVDGDMIWVLSADGVVSSISVVAGQRSEIRLHLPPDDYQGLTVGGGYVWAAGRRRGTVYRISRSGALDLPIATGAGAQGLSFADGTVWVANQHAGTLSAIDPVTGSHREIATGHDVVGVAAGAGRVLVGVVPTVDPFAGLQGSTLYMAIDGDPLGVFDPPLIWSYEMFQISNATCASLLSYVDKPAPEGWELQPELAASMPSESEDGRTYTFTVRPGVTFYPSGEPITAAALKTSLERAISAAFGDPFAYPSDVLKDLEGGAEFTAGRADHVAGIVADGDRLAITFKQHAEDQLTRLTLPFYCPVPPSIRAVPNGVNPPTGLPSAGPYYLASKLRDSAILKRNPTYSGPRTAHFDNIAIVLNQDVRTSIAEVDAGRLDYVLTYGDEALSPSGQIATAKGSGAADQRYHNAFTREISILAIDFHEPREGEPPRLLADRTVRQAVARALDRTRLAAIFGELPAGRLVSPHIKGWTDTSLLPTAAPDLELARSLMAGRTGAVTLAYPQDCNVCAAGADQIAAQLTAIGLTVASRAAEDAWSSGADMILTGFFGQWDIDPVRHVDGVPLLSTLGDMGPDDVKLVDQLGFKTGDERTKAAMALADRWAAEQAVTIPISYPVSREYFSPRVGCQVFPPSIFAVDLVALCPKGG